MHIADLDLGILGANGIVGGGPPIAMGAAFASKYRKDATVAVCFCGDGATNEGSWHEALNFAGLYKLPALFIIENNHWGEFTRQENQAPISRLSERAVSYGMPGLTVDGQDVLAVHTAAKDAVDRARAGGGPTLIEADTYRFYNHTGRGERDPRPKEEIESWRSRDPIQAYLGVLSERRILSGEGAERIVEEVRREVQDAIEFAESSPYPEAGALLQDVYS
jgi:pyruvate dehydrogenase E1 component alpha subunit